MRGFLFLLLFFLPVICHAQETIKVAVASSLYLEMQRQVTSFEKEYDVQVSLISGSTGRLYNQIVQGAPFDIFISADDKRPESLIKKGRVIAESEVGLGYLGVKLRNRILSVPRLLSSAVIKHIAIPNPYVSPFGQLAKEVLQQQGLWHVLKDKLVYTQNAMLASMMVDQGLVDAGFVPLAEPANAIAIIHYRAVVLTDKSLALRLLKYMTTNNEVTSTLASIH
ncbi:MAG: molybdate ABC transporter substrate-binding protein [Mariprofundales bacterium]